MSGKLLSPPSHWHPTNRFTTTTTVNPTPFLRFCTTRHHHRHRHRHKLPILCFSANPSKSPQPPLVVVGSANADIYVEIERVPKEGETLSAKSGETLAGGKGANQAACGAKLSYPTYFVGQVGDDAHGSLIAGALQDCGVRLDHLAVVPSVPTGNAVVMLQPGGQNSIIIVGGANMSGWPNVLPRQHFEVVASAGIVLLQREIPDHVNVEVAKVR